MDRVAEISILYDLYGGLLTEKKREIMTLYHEENLSLTEISEEKGISRAAVHDALKSAEKALYGYENKLGLAKDYLERQKLVSELKKIIDNLAPNTSENKKLNKILSKLEE